MLADARSYADRALGKARAVGVRVAVAVLNEMGELVQLDRMDGASPMAADVAEAMARTALSFEKPTSEIAKDFEGHPEKFAMIEKAVHFKLMALPGGMPIRRNGVIAGAIGVCGTEGKDEEIAKAAL
jgi:uncharacterized protein GlcG (DUF336 family)